MRNRESLQSLSLALSVLLLSGCSAATRPSAKDAGSAATSARPSVSESDDCETEPLQQLRMSAEAGGAGEIGEGMDQPSLEIVVFSLGQADSMLLIAGPETDSPKTMLVDLGEPTKTEGTIHDDYNYQVVARKLESLLPRKFIDYFVLSHYHTDHAGPHFSNQHRGIFGLIEEEGFKIGTFVHPGAAQSAYFGSAPRAVFKKTIERLGTWEANGKINEAKEAKVGDVYTLRSGVKVHVVATDGKVTPADSGTLDAIVAAHGNIYQSWGPPSENDLSIALTIEAGPFEMFTAGDLSGASESESGGSNRDYSQQSYRGANKQIYSNVEKRLASALRATPSMGDVEVYRANHHGSANSSTPVLLNTLDPEFVIYSCGGQHKHPSKEVVERVNATAWQYVTSGLDESNGGWTSGQTAFENNYRANVLERDVKIRVGQNGLWYTIDGELHKSYNDAQEDGGTLSPAGSGNDVGEEETLWQ